MNLTYLVLLINWKKISNKYAAVIRKDWWLQKKQLARRLKTTRRRLLPEGEPSHINEDHAHLQLLSPHLRRIFCVLLIHIIKPVLCPRRQRMGHPVLEH